MLSLAAVICISQSTVVFADFNGEDYGKWKVKGTAFGSAPARGTLPNQMAVTGFEGAGFVDSYIGGDGSIGTLTSPTFTIDKPYINFLIGGGYQPNRACINLIVDGQVVQTTTGAGKTPQDTEMLQPATWDVQKFRGKRATIQILDLATGGWGHINIDDITFSDAQANTPQPPLDNPMKPLDLPKPEPIYHESYRPQFHFSARQKWLNDPNGLVFYDGLYHLFFQHNPSGIQWGNMTWGHAVSKDLVHWDQRLNAIEPDSLGTIFSGSAALDEQNTTGFGTKDNPPLVAMYTAAGKPFTQCLAYSPDKGKTWKKYDHNPVLDHIVHENRDPRIFWHQPSKQWIMALYLDNDDFAIFGSPNLKQWKELSRYTLPGSNECPELFQIPVEGANESKWIFFGANFRYVVGSFDGTKFIPEQEPIRGDYGANFYASQTYNHTPDGKRIQIAWMNGSGPYPNMPFNQQMSFPCELKLHRTPTGYRLTRTPVRAIESLWMPMEHFSNISLRETEEHRFDLKKGEFDIHMRLHLTGTAKINIQGCEISIDAKEGKLHLFDHVAPIEIPTGDVDLRILVDRSSVEVFAQGGYVSMTSYIPLDSPDRGTYIESQQGQTTIERMEIHRLKSSWR